MNNIVNTLDRARAALASIPPDLAREDWVKAGMGAKAAGLSFEDFDQWSAQGSTYDAIAARDTWRSFKDDAQGVGAGSLFYMAEQYGQAPAPTKRPPAPERKPAPGHSAGEVWNRAQPASSTHPYAQRKGLTGQPLEQLRQLLEGDSLRIGGHSMAGALAVPAYGRDGQLQSLQLIPPQGQKMNLAGHAMAGASFTVGTPQTSQPLYLCEGVGAAWSCWQATGHAAICCFGWGNVSTVAQTLLASDRAAKLVLIPDVGKEASAADIARKLGCTVATMPQGEAQNFDANDLAQRDGLPALAQVLQAAQAPSVEPLTSSTWPAPIPLPNTLPPVLPFDYDLLPEALRGWIQDIAERMQCPADFPAVGALTVLSSIVGARAVISPKAQDDWQVVPNLWGLIVGRPGIMKSPALGQVKAPIERLSAEASSANAAERSKWEVQAKVTDMRIDQLEKDAKKICTKDPFKATALLEQARTLKEESEPEPIARRYETNDTSYQSLAEVLAKYAPWGILVYRDELHGLLQSLDKEGQEGARGFFLTGYDGNQGYTVDRITRAAANVPRVCLSVLGGIQPGKLQSYVRQAVSGGAGDDGLLQRFGLAVWPDATQEFKLIDRWPNTPAKQAAYEVFQRLNALEPANDDDPEVWRFSPEAQALFYQWWEPFETEIRGEELHPALVSHLAKWRKLIPALALLFALIDTPDSNNTVGIDELIRALAWGQYLRSHAERIYSAASTPETSGARLLLQRLAKLGKESFTAREIAVKGWAGLANVQAVREACELLETFGWLQRDTAQSTHGGRPKTTYWVHPELLKKEGV